MTERTEWSDYDEINLAIVDHIYTDDNSGELVYLDMNDDVRADIARKLDLSGARFDERLASVVRSRLNLGTARGSVLDLLDSRVDQWARGFRSSIAGGGDLSPPPVVAFLSLTCMAAERMGDGTMDSNAYYPRLYELLKVPTGAGPRFVRAFRDSTERYWASLAAWLEQLDGKRGLPSAESLSHRYVGLPVSQSLIRDAERRRLKIFFSDTGFSPGAVVVPGDMRDALGNWVMQAFSPATQSLQRLWGLNEDTRNRISEIACAEVAGWDGVSDRRPGSGGRGKDAAFSSRKLKLYLALVDDFFELVPKLGILITATVLDGETRIRTEGGLKEIVTADLGSHMHGVSVESLGANTADVLNSVLEVSDDTGELGRRFPSDLVVLCHDPTINAYLESERISAGIDSVVLVRKASLEGQVKDLLHTYARPGWVASVAQTSGWLGEWTMFTNVQMVGGVPATDLANHKLTNKLLPLVSPQVVVDGGLRIPARVPRWSTLAPPRLTIVSDSNKPLSVKIAPRIISSAESSEARSFGPLVPPFDIDLADLSLGDGDYSIELISGTTALHSRTLRLRSSATLDQFTWNQLPGLARFSADERWAICASEPENNDGPMVNGAWVYAEPVETKPLTPARSPGWQPRPPQPNSLISRLDLPVASADSCVVTGRHRYRFPTFDGQWSVEKWIAGTCDGCGMMVRSPANAKSARTKDRDGPAIHPILESLALASSDALVAEKKLAVIDAVTHLGGGGARSLSGLVRQLGNSALVERAFIRELESKAILEIERDDWMRPARWEIAPMAIADFGDGSCIVTGAWTQAQQLVLEDLVESGEYAFVESDEDDFLRVRRADGRNAADSLAAEFGEQEYLIDSGLDLLHALPPLSSTMQVGTLHDLPSSSGGQIFDPATNSWNAVARALAAGLYRFTAHGANDYYFATEASAASGKAHAVSAEWGKHLAAQARGMVLFFYDPDKRVLRCAPGAELPGLYERAIVLHTGTVPRRDRGTGHVVYRRVDPDFAAHLAGKMAS